MLYATIVLIMMAGVIVRGEPKCEDNEEYFACAPVDVKCNDAGEWQYPPVQCMGSGCRCKQGFKRGPNGCEKPSDKCW
ncbi:hypothetical protein TELCIR_22507 [Teladorsagia circumcincta]|uniref:TIL domain-containing protein n=1 Tax=Teladorsagia circumcincta TaxID=45464 RepID=A0A2G9TDZ1_TELCI|nr:hypothetical protein TELCIR_22507 [Teladorsagia circumcincta]